MTRGTTPTEEPLPEHMNVLNDTTKATEPLNKQVKIRTEPGPGDDLTPPEAIIMLSGYDSEASNISMLLV